MVTNGSGSGGSIAKSPSAAGGTTAKVSTAGPNSRTGASRPRPPLSLPRNAPKMMVNEPPRTGSGTSGVSGNCRSFTQVIISSGSVGRSSVHASRTSPARSNGKNIAPAYRFATG